MWAFKFKFKLPFNSLVLAALLRTAVSTLPADDSGALAYVAGDTAPGFKLNCSHANGTAYTLTSKQGITSVGGAAIPSSLIIFAMDERDLFTSHMATNNTSLAAWLHSDAVVGANTSYLFLAHCADGVGDNEAQQVTAALRARISALSEGDTLAAGTMPRMHFSTQCVEPWTSPSGQVEGTSGELAAWLSQWITPRTVIALPDNDELSRFDGKYGACPWPSEDQAFEILYGGPCKPLTKYSKKQWVVLTLDSSQPGCSADAAAEHGSASGAGGVVVVASPQAGDPGCSPLLCPENSPAQLTTGCGSGIATLVTAAGGKRLLTAIAASPSKSLNASLASVRAPGAFASIDSAGHIQEVGWEKYSTMEMLSWAAQYLDYKQQLATNLSKPAYVVPVFTGIFEGGTTTLKMPPAALLNSFSTMEVDMALTCLGNMDESCPVWDHNIALGVVCSSSRAKATALATEANTQQAEFLREPGGFEGELARWVTPFRRRIGRWLTPATQQMPLLTDGASPWCAFHTQGPSWVSTISLRFSGSAAVEGAPPASRTALFLGGSFDEDYNSNRTILLHPPPATRKVELTYTLSGHGNCEFMATTHLFFVNGEEFRWSSNGVAGTEMGCSKHVRQGRVQPNEHGTWYTGRNGWCNGADVPVHVFDVTSAVAKTGSGVVNVTYHATTRGKQPGKQGGNIVLSSSLAWYL